MLGRFLYIPNIVTAAASVLVFLYGAKQGSIGTINVNSNVMLLYLVACSAFAFLAMAPNIAQPRCDLHENKDSKTKTKASCQLKMPPTSNAMTTLISGGIALVMVLTLYWRYMNGTSTACLGIGGMKCSIIKMMVGVLIALTSATMVRVSKVN